MFPIQSIATLLYGPYYGRKSKMKCGKSCEVLDLHPLSPQPAEVNYSLFLPTMFNGVLYCAWHAGKQMIKACRKTFQQRQLACVAGKVGMYY